ncbi:MAG: thiamine pyrophosphate-dependent enzyme [Candidatus Promineifilaceae bacterium]|jgi:pyruvate/2-oxoglutarate/acetoin dehydrogenase E1 component/TPP-dependent pyruvate/acetoin dehydrogenase alpha subunit
MMNKNTDELQKKQTGTQDAQKQRLVLSREEILRDYSLVVQSRAASEIGRREVLSGKAKFGIFGDGKELAQVAMAKAFRRGDFRSGYYRDQTFMFALGQSNISQFFAQLYAHADVTADPHSAGRQMNSHYATRLLNPDGSWRNQTELYNSAADLSPTAGQMPKLAGLAYASCLYRELDELKNMTGFSRGGNEVAFGTIGNAAAAEGHFWETINAIGVLRAPAVVSIWDDGYGISVTNDLQITKQNLSVLLSGFQREPGSRDGFDIYTVKGWDYPALIEVYAKAAETARRDHVPAIIHVIEMTQPQGHSTSGSHERYKPETRLTWEEDFDCIQKFREWIIDQRIVQTGELDQIERNARKLVENIRLKAWKAFSLPIFRERQELADIMSRLQPGLADPAPMQKLLDDLLHKQTPFRKDILAAAQKALVLTADSPSPTREKLLKWKADLVRTNKAQLAGHLYSESEESALKVAAVEPVYSADSPELNGFEVLNAAFNAMLARDPRVIAFGEDVGLLGGVNQTWAGLQEKFGPLRVSDTGIREATILGQAIGLAIRGLRPIAEIQYLDYLLFALQGMADDLATLHWRTAGGQKAPLIISTRGHRLEGIWHAGSPMAGILNLVRGMYVVVPRDMVRAAAAYNTLLLSDEPGLVVEVLNGYRRKERLPDNIAEITMELGVPEILRQGEDITIVTYGAACRVALEAAEMLDQVHIDAEVIDVQTLLPFDRHSCILESLKKTSRILFVDEDVPGGATAYLMQQVIERQGGYYWLDSEPRTLTATEHRPAYGTDGGYFSKPQAGDIFNVVYDLMHEANPGRYPDVFRGNGSNK